MGKDVFILYSRIDIDVVQPFVEEINQALGIKCWMDVYGIEGGKNFPQKLKKAIDDCKIVLFMLSENSSDSKWTQREVMYAQEQGKRVIPVVIDGKGLRGIFELSLCDVQYVDIRSKEQKERLVENLKTWLTKSKANTSQIINEEDFKKIMKIVNEGEVEIEALKNILKKHDDMKLTPIKKDRKWGYSDETSEVLIPHNWKGGRNFSEGLAAVRDDKKNGGILTRRAKR